MTNKNAKTTLPVQRFIDHLDRAYVQNSSGQNIAVCANGEIANDIVYAINYIGDCANCEKEIFHGDAHTWVAAEEANYCKTCQK